MDFDSLKDDGPAQPVAPQAQVGPVSFDRLPDDQDKYGTPGQMALTAAEGAAKGALGPIATAAEAGLSGLGVPGLSPKEQEGRSEAHPWIHGGSEAVGFVAPALLSSGLSSLSQVGAIGQLGEAAAKATGLGLEGASTISRIAASGIKTGAEMAALQAGDEVSKLINQDPNQSVQSAAINVGLSGLIGGAGGAVIGAISPLWKASLEKAGVPKLIDDAKAQYGFRQGLPNGGDVPAAITDELSTRMGEVDNLRTQMGELKGSALARAMPEVSEANSSKINAQIEDISAQMAKNIEKASDNAYLKGAVPKLQQDFQDFLEVATNPQASYADRFEAIDNLKRAQQAKAKYNLTAEDSALGAFTKGTARDLRLALEDPKVWGDAADIQRKVNEAIKTSIDAEKDAASKFTSKVLGDRVADPNKVSTLVNQTLKGKAGLKTDVMSHYIENTEALADTINKIHTDAGLEAPIALTPTPALNHTLGRSSPGTTLGNWLFDKGLASVAGHVGGEAVGAGLGSLVGHPALGAIAGERILAPTLTAISKPLLESASRSEAFKGSLDYIGSVIKGENILGKATRNFFKSGEEILPEQLAASQESRDKLEKSLNHMTNPDNVLQIGSNLGHYLPNHTTAAASTAARASAYLKNLKPVQVQASPLDKPLPIDQARQYQYNRALDIAQQPLLALKYARNGTLQPADVMALKAIYPNLYNHIVTQTFNSMTKAIAEGRDIPYYQRVSLSLLMGQPLDSTMTQATLQTIMIANAPKGGTQQGQPKHPSQATANSMQKTDQMYATPNQARSAFRASGK